MDSCNSVLEMISLGALLEGSSLGAFSSLGGFKFLDIHNDDFIIPLRAFKHARAF